MQHHHTTSHLTKVPHRLLMHASNSLFFCCLLIFTTLGGNAQSYMGTITKQVNLREGPGTDYKVMASLKPQTQLFVASLEVEDGFYSVIDIATNKAGYVHKSFVVLGEELPASEGGLFTPSGSSGQENPEVEIYNNTEKILTLKLNDLRYTFLPQQRQTIDLKATAYDYIASAPNVIPNHGVETLKSNTRYTWQFYIVTRRN